MFNKAFLGRYFSKEKREVKVVEFINLHQGGMSVLEYSLKFTKLSKYVHSLVYKRKSRDAKMARFFDGGSSKGRLEIQDKPRLKKRVSNHVPL